MQVFVKCNGRIVSNLEFRYDALLVHRIEVNYPLVPEAQHGSVVAVKHTVFNIKPTKQELAEGDVILDYACPVALFALRSENLTPVDYCVVQENV